ncbi:hypothetical protein [Kitasatospora sp. NPDC054795]
MRIPQKSAAVLAAAVALAGLTALGAERRRTAPNGVGAGPRPRRRQP